MIVPLTLGDFLERAELVYGDREAVVDEPNPPGGGLGRVTYAGLAAMARSLAAALDDLGVGENERVAIVSPNAARFLVSLFGVSVFGRILVPVNFRLNAVTFGLHLALTDRDVYLHTLPMFPCNGWGMPYALTAMGARHVIIRKIDGEDILKRVEAEGVTLFNCAPAVIAAVLDAATARRQRGEPVPGAGRVRVVVAGAPPPSKTIERVEAELGWEFVQIYGLTETSPLLTTNRAPAEWDALDREERARRLSRAGVPAVGVRMAVDETGEILARSNHVYEGYWKQPEETAKTIVDGWFNTGDGGRAGGAVIVGQDRKKGVIITGGDNGSS